VAQGNRIVFEESSSRVLTPGAFHFVLDMELKRAIRAQTVLTLFVIDAEREWEGMAIASDHPTLRTLADLIADEVRETDILGRTGEGTLSLVLLDADFESATRAVNRILSRADRFDFHVNLRLVVGGASCPLHGGDAPTLMRYAVSHPSTSWRTQSRN
jgi:GGDEF domain-containing protein